MIRVAEASDAPAIAALWNWMIRDTQSTFTSEQKRDDDIAALIRDRPGQCYLSVDKILSGFVIFGPFRSGPGYSATCEHSIVIAPEAQGRGLGRALLERAETVACETGYHVMVAAISGTNTGAISFHKAQGFAEVGRMPEVGRKWDQWLDLILMQKILVPGR